MTILFRLFTRLWLAVLWIFAGMVAVGAILLCATSICLALHRPLPGGSWLKNVVLHQPPGTGPHAALVRSAATQPRGLGESP